MKAFNVAFKNTLIWPTDVSKSSIGRKTVLQDWKEIVSDNQDVLVYCIILSYEDDLWAKSELESYEQKLNL